MFVGSAVAPLLTFVIIILRKKKNYMKFIMDFI